MIPIKGWWVNSYFIAGGSVLIPKISKTNKIYLVQVISNRMSNANISSTTIAIMPDLNPDFDEKISGEPKKFITPSKAEIRIKIDDLM